MKLFKKIGKALIFPHGIVFLFLVPLSIALLVYSFTFSDVRDAVKYASYAVSAYTLTALCFKTPSIIRFWRKIKQENKYAVRYFSDTHLRVNISLYGSFIYNSAYAIFQIMLGIYHSSIWFYSVAAYYVLLAVMRLYLLLYTRTHTVGEAKAAELHRYRFCGIILLIMNLALSVIVFYITWQNRTFRHHEITTIAMAAYTFISFTTAIINMVKYRKYQSPVYSAAKVISFTSAMVSMLTLETAMLTAFGDAGGQSFNRLMTGITGTAVVLTVLVMAIYMIANGTRKLRILRLNNSQT